jgi:hypothetical protein
MHQECGLLEGKIGLLTGFIFVRHQYTAEELLQSEHLSRIESYAGKIKDDVERWESAHQLPFRVRMVYNENAMAIQSRISRTIARIKEREPTLWEKVCGVFTRLLAAVTKLLPLFAVNLLSGGKGRKLIGGSLD